MSTATNYTQAYRELSQEVHDAGLIRRRYGFTWSMMLGLVAALAVLIGLLVWLGPTWWQLVVAAGFSVIMAQLGLLSHEAAHRQLFASRAWNEWVARILACLFVGLSYGWWVAKHNTHHGHPNQVGKDPDVISNTLAFTPEAAEQRRGVRARLAKHQGWFFIPLLLLEGLNLHVQSVRRLLSTTKVPHRFTELAFLLLRHAVYLALLFLIFPVGMAFAFVGLQVGTFGLLLGGVFALNHIGMPTVAAGTRVDFLRRQIIMSRNITDGPVVRFFMGGLQYQIEHHLFPAAPRPNLPAIQQLVYKYCARYAIPYVQRDVAEASRTVLAYLNQVGTKHRDPFICPLVQRFRT